MFSDIKVPLLYDPSEVHVEAEHFEMMQDFAHLACQSTVQTEEWDYFACLCYDVSPNVFLVERKLLHIIFTGFQSSNQERVLRTLTYLDILTTMWTQQLASLALKKPYLCQVGIESESPVESTVEPDLPLSDAALSIADELFKILPSTQNVLVYRILHSILPLINFHLEAAYQSQPQLVSQTVTDLFRFLHAMTESSSDFMNRFLCQFVVQFKDLHEDWLSIVDQELKSKQGLETMRALIEFQFKQGIIQLNDLLPILRNSKSISFASILLSFFDSLDSLKRQDLILLAAILLHWSEYPQVSFQNTHRLDGFYHFFIDSKINGSIQIKWRTRAPFADSLNLSSNLI
jgi:hypothetical protein